jgi:hypothetical protein
MELKRLAFAFKSIQVNMTIIAKGDCKVWTHGKISTLRAFLLYAVHAKRVIAGYAAGLTQIN